MPFLCGGGSSAGAVLTEEEKKAAATAKKTLKAQAEADEKPVKMLLLGAGESGKSTIFKQMKVINKDGFTKAERQEFIPIVHSNIVTSMKNLLMAFEKLGEPMPDSVKTNFDKYCTPDPLPVGYEPSNTQKDVQDDKLTPEVAEIIAALWADASVLAIFERRSEYQLNDSAEFYFNSIERLRTPGYLPSEDDVLRSRVRTTGIVQSDFKIKGIDFAMFDVGGQRNERRKWIHCFDNVDAVVFVAACSEFDQVLFEDETMNRMDEALSLFAQIVNSKWFKDTSLILFLNKKDLFEQKLKKKVFADYINKDAQRDRYEGPNEMQPCADHLKKLFLQKNKSPDKSIFTHITTAIDTSNVKFVFNAVVAMILEENLKNSGLAG